MTQDAPLPKEQLLIKLMLMTTSNNDAEALVALRKANDLLRANKWDWEKLIRSKIKIIEDPFKNMNIPQPAAAPPPRGFQTPQKPVDYTQPFASSSGGGARATTTSWAKAPPPPPPPPPRPPAVLSMSMKELVRKGDIIGAIKQLRADQPHLSATEATAAIKLYETNFKNWQAKQPKPKPFKSSHLRGNTVDLADI